MIMINCEWWWWMEETHRFGGKDRTRWRRGASWCRRGFRIGRGCCNRLWWGGRRGGRGRWPLGSRRGCWRWELRIRTFRIGSDAGFGSRNWLKEEREPDKTKQRRSEPLPPSGNFCTKMNEIIMINEQWKFYYLFIFSLSFSICLIN